MPKLLISALCASAVWAFSQPVVATESAPQSIPALQTVEGRDVVGWVEFVTFDQFGVVAKAKLDSGAMTSSLHAKKIEYFKKNGKPWVRFVFDKKARPAKHGMPAVPRQKKTIEAPVKRMVKIKQHTVDFVERPVVDLEMTVGGKTYLTEFSLTDRSSFIYPVLLGRRFLQTALIVDAARIHVTGAPDILLQTPASEKLEKSEESNGKADEPALP